ncbi:MAG: HAMP domain-containing histidine kinase [Ktedonobacteraceae bacterium]|nr:HAMP domain-containing histidine kinase [Ktedonobacteraceae bacterium]
MNKLLRHLLTLPHPVRVFITLTCASLGLIIYMVSFPLTHNGNILPVAVGITTWMFKKKGFFIYIIVGTPILLIYHALRIGSLLWSYTFIFSFTAGFLTLLLECFFVITLRELVDSADEARNRAQEAEKRVEVAYEQQYQLNQIKDQFLISMNHELRTPLTELHGYLELLYERYEQINSTTQIRYIEHAFQASQELQQLTYNVLDAMQIDDQGKVLLAEEFALAGQVENIVKHLSADKLENYTIQVEIPADLTAFANAQAMRHIVHNLLSNVFKYAPLHTKISIDAQQIYKEGKEQICLSVQDEGAGIPPDEMPLLFQQFVRLKRDISGPIRGTGLGLYICRKLVEAMGGSIWVESDGISGHGSRFSFTLPMMKQTSQNMNISMDEQRVSR